MLGVSAGLVAGYRYWLDLQADLQRLNAVIEEAAREILGYEKPGRLRLTNVPR